MEKMYIIVCPERSTDELTYWKASRTGYTQSIDVAGRCTKEEADKICNQPYVKDYAIEVDTPMRTCGNCAYKVDMTMNLLLYCEHHKAEIDFGKDPTCTEWASEEELRIERRSW